MNKKIKGYHLVQEEYVQEIESQVYLYEHEKTKAKVLFMANTDSHKTFGIGFRTPPQDSTGTPHIIEHSVLCGSRKFPMKDPFIELSKGSLNTYLNAMTYPDKTLYPVSSQNDADFHNLMDVYLDAVFFPNIYKNDAILMQEGWRYHIEKPEDELVYKGVVYNEMKGAFSSPEEVSFRKIKEALFPDTIYANESGGAPEAIPDLTYEAFIDFHKTYYHPSNAYIGLYGDMDIEATLTFMDTSYLSHFDYQAIDSKIAYQKPFEAPKEVTKYYSVAEEKDEQIYLSYNWVVGETINRELVVAMGILEYLLLDTPASPLKKALIKEGIGEDVFGVFQTHLKQPIFSIMAKNVSEAKRARFYTLIDEELKRLQTEGFSKELIDAAIQVKEFEIRENDSRGYSKGLMSFISSLKSWIYDESPFIYLRNEKLLNTIHKEKNAGYFEGLIQTYLLQNTHCVKLTLEPQVGLDQKIEDAVTEKLKQVKTSWSQQELQQMIDKTLAFNAYQEQEDTQEVKQSIPLLTKEELTKEVEYPRYETLQKNKRKYIVSKLATNKIAYMSWYIDLEGIENEYVPYLGMLVGMLGKLDTKNYNYENLAITIDAHLGGLEHHIQAFHNLEEPNAFRKVFSIKSKALVSECTWQVDLMKELIATTSFKDQKRIREIIKEMKAMMEMGLSSEGHKIAYSRLLASFSPTERFEEETKGLTFYHFVCDIDKRFETESEKILEQIEKAYGYLQNSMRYTIGLTTDEASVETCIETIENVLQTLPSEQIQPLKHDFVAEPIQEGIIYPGNVNYVALGYNFKETGTSYNGGLLMLKSILSTEYLWQTVRVKNGAYGCFADFRKSGNAFFVSYRDPNISETLQAYKDVADYVENLNLSERELTQYLIGTISGMDFPYTPASEGRTGQIYALTGTTKEDLQKTRDELFATDNATLKNFAPMLRAVVDKNQYCVFGNTTSIPSNEQLFKKITKA